VKKLLPLLVALAVLVTGACGVAKTTAASVNGDKITQKELDDELKAIAANKEYAALVSQGGQTVTGAGSGTFDAAFAAKVLTRRIYFQLVEQELGRRKLSVGSRDLSSAKQTIEEQIGNGDVAAGAKVFDKFAKDYQDSIVRRQAEVAVLQEKIGNASSSDADLQAYYDQHKADLAQVCVMHVLTDTEAEAAAAKADITKGADFGQVAFDRSKDPSAKTSGQPGFRGDLGCAPPSTYVKEFADATAALTLNQLSDPVKTQFGYHILKVYDRKTPTFDEVKPQIQQQLAQEGSDAFTAWLSKAVGKAKVDVNPKYGRFSKEDDQPQVVPPEAPKSGTTTTTDGGLPGTPVPQTAPPTTVAGGTTQTTAAAPGG
jgi:parvulin-like peptidyl-prolyl isomerase